MPGCCTSVTVMLLYLTAYLGWGVAMLAGARGDPDAELSIAEIASRATGRGRSVPELAEALAEPG